MAFIVPVKHPARSRSYEIVTNLLRSTLRSIEGQLGAPFATVVVCNQRPDWARDSDRLRFVEVSFPPAEPPARREDWVDWLYEDKGCKIAVGLNVARAFNPSHVMFVDADDFVSRRLAAWVRDHPTDNGWFMPDGLIYSGLFRIAEPRDRFWSYCGTTHVLRTDLVPVPDSIGPASRKEEVVSALESFYLRRILGCHVDFIKYFDARGTPLAPLPFVGGVWHADTGENSSRAWWNQTRFGPIWGKPLTAEQEAEFGITVTPRSVAASALLYGWRARSVVANAIKRTGLIPAAAR